MSGSGKILTVSYGTFSCTLEGFDDPFSTMRTIAEYFRDLAAEDRFFGAEPPTPDPDLLQTLAEREARKRVEARVSDGGIALRQIAPGAAHAPIPSHRDVTDTPVAFEADEPQNAFTDLGGGGASSSENIAEKLKRIRAVVSRSRDVQPFPNDAENKGTDVPSSSGPSAESEDAPPQMEPSVKAEPVGPEVPEDSFGEPEVIAEGAEEPTDQETDFPSEDQLREARLKATLEALSDTGLDDQAHFDDDDDGETSATAALDAHLAEQAETAEREEFCEDLESAVDDDADEPVATSEVPTEQDASDVGIEEDDAPDAQVEPQEVHAEAELDEDKILTIRRLLAEAGVDAPPGLAPVSRPIVAASSDDDEEDDPAEMAEVQEHEAAPEPVEDSELDADESEVDEDNGILHLTNGDAVEDVAKTWEDDTEGEDEMEGRTSYGGPTATLRLIADDAVTEPRDAHSRLSDAAEADVNRLMAEAEHQFEDGEGQRRRRVISQLRAAVVAAKADRAMGKVPLEAEGDASDQVAYREDLTRTISRPRATEASEVHPAEAAAAMPGAPITPETEDRPSETAPLMLASEQRVAPEVDDDAIQPQRVSKDSAAPSQRDAASFAEFAQTMGAEDLSDLLEAAAAYTAFVEGMPSFSRPQIMKRVARVKPQVEVSREEGLRSFGQLLRQGKIQKLQRGQFTISETTRFHPGHRIAGE